MKNLQTFEEFANESEVNESEINESEINEAEINFIPQEGVTHSIVFKNPVAAYMKLVKSKVDIDFDNVGFVFPDMSRETWNEIKSLFTSKDIGDMGQYKK